MDSRNYENLLYRFTAARGWTNFTGRHGVRSLYAALLTISLAASAWAQGRPPATPSGAVPTTFFGMSINSNNHQYPAAGTKFGLLRLWDTPGTSWPDMQSASGASLSTTNLDQVLKDAYNNSPSHDAVVMYTFGRIPFWATSNTADTNCAYYNSAVWNPSTDKPLQVGPGQCDPPSDLFNSSGKGDGSGTDAYWRAFITALANHLTNQQINTPNTYAPVVYFETWNEIDRSDVLTNDSSNISYNGTYAQLLRMTEDMRCIFLGTGTIHNYPTAGSSTPCSSTTWTGQSVGIFKSAKIVSPSAHAQGANYLKATSIEKNFLHCDVTGTYAPPANTYCNWGPNNGQTNWGAKAVDIINFHMKPGNESQTFSNSSPNTDPETEMATEYTNASAVLESGDPTTLWNGESGYSGASPCGWAPSGGDVDLNSLPGEQAAFVGRYFMVMWSLGIQNSNWYQYDNSNFLEGSCVSGSHSNGSNNLSWTAYNTIETWMAGNTMSSSGCFANATFTDPQNSKTLWSCTFTNGTWTGKVIWDSNPYYSCNGGASNPCTTTYPYTVGSSWSSYQSAVGSLTPLTSPYQIQVSNMPTIVVTGTIPRTR